MNYLSQREHTLLRSDAATLDHDEVLLDHTVVREAAHRVDGLVSQVVIGSSVVLHKLEIKLKEIVKIKQHIKCANQRFVKLFSEPWKKIMDKQMQRITNVFIECVTPSSKNYQN